MIPTPETLREILNALARLSVYSSIPRAQELQSAGNEHSEAWAECEQARQRAEQVVLTIRAWQAKPLTMTAETLLDLILAALAPDAPKQEDED